ncbi:abortive infection system antitoxin AbiGi family protein [Flavobacterium rivuli]|nr:abortive infection system antitoxin AbiGi family protein [Flavobacterium rivuli]
MGLSSNSIIHFTKNFSSLKGILEGNFKIKYCRETIHSTLKSIDVLIPMVSFCDIPFSQILNHIDSYGSYGLGLKKTWAEKNGLNPVLYLDKSSSLSNNISVHLISRLIDGKNKITDLDENEKRTLDIVRYIKNYQGNLVRFRKKIILNYRFSDEREWRYVLDTSHESLIFGNIINFDNNENRIKSAKAKNNTKIENERLAFTPEDISYIIVKAESERDVLIRSLERIKGKYPHDEVKRLTSRILSVEQLKTDF